MAAKRPLVMAALKAALVTGVTSVSSRVYLPWEAKPEIRDVGSYLQIEIEGSTVDDLVISGQWQHEIQVQIGAIKAGAFDYPAVWELLNVASATITADPTLGGTCWRVDITGCDDAVTISGDKILWPHLAATIYYLTPVGAI